MSVGSTILRAEPSRHYRTKSTYSHLIMCSLLKVMEGDKKLAKNHIIVGDF